MQQSKSYCYLLRPLLNPGSVHKPNFNAAGDVLQTLCQHYFYMLFQVVTSQACSATHPPRGNTPIRRVIWGSEIP